MLMCKGRKHAKNNVGYSACSKSLDEVSRHLVLRSTVSPKLLLPPHLVCLPTTAEGQGGGGGGGRPHKTLRGGGGEGGGYLSL